MIQVSDLSNCRNNVNYCTTCGEEKENVVKIYLCVKDDKNVLSGFQLCEDCRREMITALKEYTD